jgi:hypothetical protein
MKLGNMLSTSYPSFYIFVVVIILKVHMQSFGKNLGAHFKKLLDIIILIWRGINFLKQNTLNNQHFTL